MADDFRYYQLTRDPFSKELPARDAFETEDLRQACGRLDFLSRAGGVGLLTAQPGYGKTFAVRRWSEVRAPGDVDVRYLCLSTVSVIEFYRQLCATLGLEPSMRKAGMFAAIQDHLRTQWVDKRVRTVVVLDEAQYLDGAVLRDLTMLTNFDMDSRNYVAFALVGQTFTADKICRGAYEPLRQRIVVNYEFGGLTGQEAVGYAQHMLRAAGGSASVITEAAVTAAHGVASGSVRRLGSILSTALRIGAQQGVREIDAEMVMSASREVALR